MPPGDQRSRIKYLSALRQRGRRAEERMAITRLQSLWMRSGREPQAADVLNAAAQSKLHRKAQAWVRQTLPAPPARMKARPRPTIQAYDEQA
jgi:hypothetical protein